MAVKKSFVMYTSWATLIENLPDDQAGQLIKAICAYQLGHEVQIQDQATNAMYLMILPKMEEDDEIYQRKVDNAIACTRKRNESVRKRNESVPERNGNAGVSVSVSVSDTVSENTKKQNTNTFAQSDAKSASASEPLAEMLEAIPLNNGTEWKPTLRQYEEYCRLYGNVDVPEEFRKMRGWCLSNPSRRKTSKGIARFVNSWLSREQDKCRTTSPRANTTGTGNLGSLGGFFDI